MDLLQLFFTAWLGCFFAAGTSSAAAVAGSTGTIQCPENFGQPGALYANSKVYNWTIRGPKAVAIRFHFAGLESQFDRLELFERTKDLNESYTRAPKFRIESKNATSQVFTLLAPVLIKFSTDSSIAGKGFNLTYMYTLEEALEPGINAHLSMIRYTIWIILVRYRYFSENTNNEICSEPEIPGQELSEADIDYRWVIDWPGRIDLTLSFSDLARIYQMTTAPYKEPVFTDGPKQRETVSEFRLFGPLQIRVTTRRPSGRIFRLSYSSDGGG